MGYTHYLSFNIRRNRELEKKYQLAIKDCNKIIKAYQRIAETDNRLSGYSAHAKGYGGINFNGKKELSHEPFILREHLNQNERSIFCKTAEKPYDLVVVACLSVLKHRLKDAITVGSYGCFHDWDLGVRFAQFVTKLKLKNPLRISVSGE